VAKTIFALLLLCTAAAAGPHKDQPAATKLKLGHFSNDKRGLGLTIDLTEKNDNVAKLDPAKVRFDGETKVWRLEGKHGPGGRIDYMRDARHVLLHVWSDGRIGVFVPDAADEEIDVHRDADADPL